MTKVEYPLAIICVFTWIGFVCAISFLEAWLKFRAPGVTLAIGLGIGRLVFNVLNKVEWVFALVIAITALLSNAPVISWQNGLFAIVLVTLIVQTTWLLPGLDARAELHIAGMPVAPSNLHFYFIAAELIKTISLLVFGVNLFKH